MKILVTGGTGFVGKKVLEELVRFRDVTSHGMPITTHKHGTFRLEIWATGKSDENKLPTSVRCFTTNDLASLPIGGEFKTVIHLAANNDTLCTNRYDMFRTNLYEPIALFQRLYLNGCRTFIYASSTAVYGNSPAPYKEDTPTNPLNVYAESKLEFDRFAMDFACKYGVTVMGLRYCNIYGPGEEHKERRMSMIGQLIRNAIAGEELKLFKAGEQLRDWVHINDVGDVNLQAFLEPRTGIYNIGSGKAYSFNDIVHEIKKRLPQAVVSFVDCPFAESYQYHTECDISKACVELGYEPKYDLAKGIESYFENLTSSS